MAPVALGMHVHEALCAAEDELTAAWAAQRLEGIPDLDDLVVDDLPNYQAAAAMLPC